MAEFIIAFLAGMGTLALILATLQAWDNRSYITHEFKERIGGDPMGDLYGHAYATGSTMDTVSSNTTTGTGTTMANVGNVTWSHEFNDPDPTDPIPEWLDAQWGDEAGRGYDPDEFNGPPLFDADGMPIEVTSFGEEPPHEFDLGEALYGTSPHTEAPHMPPTTEDLSEAAHIAALLEPSPTDPYAEDDAAYLEALTGYESPRPAPNKREALAEALRTHPAP